MLSWSVCFWSFFLKMKTGCTRHKHAINGTNSSPFDQQMATLNQNNHPGVARELGRRWVIITPRLIITPHPGAPVQFTIMEPLIWSRFSRFKMENCMKPMFMKGQALENPHCHRCWTLRTTVTKVPSDHVHDAPAALSTALVYLILIW